MSREKLRCDKNLGQRIKHIRELKGLTQQEFASSLGITQGFLSEIERGIKPPSETLLLLIAYRYAINYDWLRTGEGEIFLILEKFPPDNEIFEIIQLLQEDPKAKKLVLKLLKGKKEMQEALQGFKVKVVEEG